MSDDKKRFVWGNARIGFEKDADFDFETGQFIPKSMLWLDMRNDGEEIVLLSPGDARLEFQLGNIPTISGHIKLNEETGQFEFFQDEDE